MAATDRPTSFGFGFAFGFLTMNTTTLTLPAREVLRWAESWACSADHPGLDWLRSLAPEHPCPEPPNPAWASWFAYRSVRDWPAERWAAHGATLAAAVAHDPHYSMRTQS